MKPFATCEHPGGLFVGSMGNRARQAPYYLNSHEATDSLAPYIRKNRQDSIVPATTRLDKLAAEFPDLARFLAKCARQGLDDTGIKQAVHRAASASPLAAARWNQFFAKAAASPPGVPEIGGTQGNPTSATPGFDLSKPPPSSLSNPGLSMGEHAGILAHTLGSGARDAWNGVSGGFGRIAKGIRGMAYAGGGGIGALAAGTAATGSRFTNGADSPQTHGLNDLTRSFGDAAGAGLHDTFVQPFTGHSAVTQMNQANQFRLANMPPGETVLGYTGPQAVDHVDFWDGAANLTANAAAGLGATKLLAPGSLMGRAAAVKFTPKQLAVGAGTTAVGATKFIAGDQLFRRGIDMAQEALDNRNPIPPGITPENAFEAARRGDISLAQYDQIMSGRAGVQPATSPAGDSFRDEQPAADVAEQTPAGGPKPQPQAATPAQPQAAPAAQPQEAPAAQPQEASAADLQPLKTVTGQTIAQMSPEEAQARGQRADQNLASFTERAKTMTREQQQQELHATINDKLAAEAKATGQDPTELAAKLAHGEVTPEDAQRISQTPFGQQLGQHAAQSGFPPLDAILSFFQGNSPMWQKILAGVGIPLGVMGLASSIFGDGGMNGLLMGVLGLGAGAAGLGAFGGFGGPHGPMTDMVNQGVQGLQGWWNGLQQPAAAPPAAVPPAEEMPNGPDAFAPANPDATTPAAGAKPSIASLMSDQQISPDELQALQHSPELKQELMGMPPAQQDAFMRMTMQGNPEFKQQMGNAQFWGGTKNPMVQAEAAKLGLSPQEMDALLASYGRVGG